MSSCERSPCTAGAAAQSLMNAFTASFAGSAFRKRSAAVARRRSQTPGSRSEPSPPRAPSRRSPSGARPRSRALTTRPRGRAPASPSPPPAPARRGSRSGGARAARRLRFFVFLFGIFFYERPRLGSGRVRRPGREIKEAWGQSDRARLRAYPEESDGVSRRLAASRARLAEPRFSKKKTFLREQTETDGRFPGKRSSTCPMEVFARRARTCVGGVACFVAAGPGRDL